MSCDVIIIGTGAGGGTLLHALAPTGKRILVLEGGDFVRREPEMHDAGPHGAAARGARVRAKTKRAVLTSSPCCAALRRERGLSTFTRRLLRCPRCEGRMTIIATVTDPDAVRKILACVGLPARPPPLPPAKAKGQGELAFEG